MTEGLCKTKTSPKEKKRKHLGTRVLLSQLKQMGETGWSVPLHPWSLQSENVNSSNSIKRIAGKSLPMHWLSTNFGKLEALHRPMGSHCPAKGALSKY